MVVCSAHPDITYKIVCTNVSPESVIPTTNSLLRTSATVFRFLDMGTKLLEIEAGYTENESVTYAVRKAIDKAIVDMISEGAEKGLWKYKKTENDKEGEDE